MNFLKTTSKWAVVALTVFLNCHMALSQGSVSRSGSTWTAKVNGNTVYTGSRMFDAVNAACNNMGSGTIDIWNSGDSGNDNGGSSIYAIRPQANQTLDFHGHTVNCNSTGDLISVVYADRRNDITVRNLHVTGNPRYAIWFRGCSNMTFTDITMNLSNDSPVGLGIRVDASTGSSNNLTINGNININGSAGHAIETYTVGGVTIGDVTVTNTGGCGVLLNDSWDCNVGVVTGDRNNQGGGYATFRVANQNENTYCAGVYSRNSGRGFFSVSGSRDCTVAWVDIANTTSHGIFLEDATNTHVLSGTVSNGNPNTQLVRTTNCSITLNGGGTPPSSNVYRLQNRGTGLFLDGYGRTSNGSDCSQYGNTTHPNAQWEFVDAGSGYTQLRNVGTGLFLDGMGRTDNGANVGQWANTTHHNSHWAVQQFDGNYYRLQNRGTGLYLDGMGRSNNGDICGQWANTTHPNAQWQLVSASGSRQISTDQTELESDAELIKVYPNPTSDFVKVDLPELTGTESIRIVNVMGQEIMRSKIRHESQRIDIRQLIPGQYILQIQMNDQMIQRKIVKI